MDRLELKHKLDLLKVDPNQYSLNGDLIPDSIILYNSYNEWEVFYLDERGGRNDIRVFNTEDEACRYILSIFENSKEIERKFFS